MCNILTVKAYTVDKTKTLKTIMETIGKNYKNTLIRGFRADREKISRTDMDP
jgi:hypothetical protein